MDIQISDIDTDDEFHDDSCGYFNLNWKLRPTQTITENRIDSYTIKNNDFSGKILIGPIINNKIKFNSELNFIYKRKEFNKGNILVDLKSEININSFLIESRQMKSGEIWIRIRKICDENDIDPHKLLPPFCINYKIICCQPISKKDKIQLLFYKK